jgi:hypothetical protein
MGKPAKGNEEVEDLDLEGGPEEEENFFDVSRICSSEARRGAWVK